MAGAGGGGKEGRNRAERRAMTYVDEYPAAAGGINGAATQSVWLVVPLPIRGAVLGRSELAVLPRF